MLTSITGLRRRLGLTCTATAAAVALVVAGPGAALGASGDLDPTFGAGDGIVITDLAYYEDSPDMVLQPDGKILTVGTLTPAEGGDSAFSLLRYNADGSPDTTFGDGGAVATTISSGDSGQALTLQPDGKIVVAGSSIVEQNGIAWGQFTLLRYLPNGTLDTTFGDAGRVFPDFGQGSSGAAVRVLGNGRILAAGGAQGGFALARLMPDGSLDNTFGGGDGRVTSPFAVGGASVQDLALQSDGTIVAVGTAGYVPPAYSTDVVMARYTPDGSPDTGFDGDGQLLLDWGTAIDAANGVVLQPDSKIVVSGYSSEGFTTARFNTNGTPDTTFGGDGRVGTTFEAGSGVANDVALQSDGKIVAAGGGAGTGDPHDFAVVRYNTDGSLDSTFSGDGKVTTDVGPFYEDDWEQGQALVIQPDGKLVVAGVTEDGTARGVIRYEVSGTTPPPATADLLVTKTGTPATVALGDAVTYTVKVTNKSASTATATGVQLTDSLTGTGNGTILSATTSQGSCTNTPSQATCALGSLAPNTTATVTITAEPSRVGTLTDTATASATQSDPVPADNTASAATTVNNTRGCTITGTSGNDTINGTFSNDVICALSGNDTVNASFGNDTVHAGPGNDRVDGGYGDDTLFGGPGSDNLIGNFGNDRLNTVDGVPANDTANGGYNTDTCTTDTGDTRVSCP
ncbi:calcium-binding protein [Streptomyces sp. NBC_00047]|uniref:calcium-binding protein n=1 Tax=Streptomyces sp. NBC_00047 TaxID=2975627 RepID=UPI00225A4F75|nr:calcium-binding protein [Streptomyces sp. NBC_00047]MCX5607622.1 calcium-binding protein [Streptomyces sp. NBC_00047]